MKKTLDKILNITLVSLIIITLISYQLILPSILARADDSTAATSTPAPAATDSSSSSSSDSGASDSSKATSSTDTTKDTSSPTDTTDKNTNTASTTPATPTATAQTSSGDTTTPQPEAGPPSAETTITPTTDTTTPPLTAAATPISDCACQSDSTQKPDCQNPCPTDCQCCADVCSQISNTNITEDSSITTASESNTGGNTIANDPATATDTAGAATPADSTGANQSSDNNQSNNTDNTTDPSNTPAQTGTENTATIATGDASAAATAVNQINTNITTDNGAETVQNITGDYSGDVNLLDAFNSILDKAGDLSDQNKKDLENMIVTNVNAAKDVSNTAAAAASSGDNTIANDGGSADISTGNADAIASAINIINTNITGDNWLFAIINVFGNWTGNLIVPGAGLLSLPGAGMLFSNVTNVNKAINVENSVSADANTGNNSISDSKNASIQTGDATTSANATNIINTNITSNNWFFLLINNGGSWTGQVINWTDGVESTAYEYNFGTLDDSSTPAKNVSVYNTNTAENVSNTVVASANTGGNQISSSGMSSISTGNAGAWASAFNLINTNITGNNWLFGIVNNAGNWSGNVVFAYPDLAVSLSPDKNQIEPGQDLTYTLTYKNVGQAACGNVDLNLSLPKYLSYLSDNGSSGTGDSENRHWSLAGLNPGEEKSFEITAALASDTPESITALDSSMEASTNTAEKNLSNNSASSDVNIIFPKITIEDGGVQEQNGSALKISRKDDATDAVGVIANHFVTVANSGKNTLYNIFVTEKIKDPGGNNAAQYSWTIPKLKKGQKALIQYQIFMGPQAQLGTYEYSASALGYDKTGYAVKAGNAKAKINLVAGAGLANNLITQDSQQLIPSAEASGFSNPQEVLGANTANSNNFPWLLAWILSASATMGYFIQKKKLYNWQTLQKVARQASGFFSSWF